MVNAAQRVLVSCGSFRAPPKVVSSSQKRITFQRVVVRTGLNASRIGLGFWFEDSFANWLVSIIFPKSIQNLRLDCFAQRLWARYLKAPRLGPDPN